MIMTYKISEGTKVTLNGGQLTFQCKPNEVGAAYDALYESIELIDKNGNSIPDGPFSLGGSYLEDIQQASLKPKYVATFLDGMKRMGFIGDWEASSSNNCNKKEVTYKMINIDKNLFAPAAFNAGPILKLLMTTAQDYAGECNTLEELREHAYNEDYNYIYYKDAETALQMAGVFDCFQVVHCYMMDIFGEDNTDYSDPVNVANSLLYIQGEKITQAVADWLGVELDDELDPEEWNKLLCATINNLIPFLDDFHSFKAY